MRLFEFSKSDGLFVGARFSDEANERLAQYCKDAGIPNALSEIDFHITVASSRKSVKYTPEGRLDPAVEVLPVGFHVWDNSDGSQCLVVALDAPEISRRHEAIRDLGATWSYPEYNPHVTLSYDIGGFDPETLPDPAGLGPLSVVEIYAEPLDEDWEKA